jgi:hypothetical protein
VTLELDPKQALELSGGRDSCRKGTTPKSESDAIEEKGELG